jgi:hypothetical protein
MVHEAALQSDAPLPGAGFRYFEAVASFPHINKAGCISPDDIALVGSCDGITMLDEACKKRIEKNNEYWRKYYLQSVDLDRYLEEDFRQMPPVDFTVGCWTPSWLVYANIETAKRGNCPVTWLHSSHHPERVCPEELAEFIRKTVQKYLHGT